MYEPDILFMQEIKGTQDKFSPYLNTPSPYTAYYNSAEKAGYAGTGVWIHERVFLEYEVIFASSFPNDPTANEGRVAHVQLTVKDFFIAKNEAIQVSEKRSEHGLLPLSQ